MSGWTDIEEPGGPEGVATTGENQPDPAIRVDEETGGTPGDQPMMTYQDGMLVRAPNADVPMAVVVQGKVEIQKRKKVRAVFRHHELNNGQAPQQILTEDPYRTRAVIVNIGEDGTHSDVYLANDPHDVSIGFRLRVGNELEVTSTEPIYAVAASSLAAVPDALVEVVSESNVK